MAQARKSRDDISAVVVFLKPTPVAVPPALAPVSSEQRVLSSSISMDIESVTDKVKKVSTPKKAATVSPQKPNSSLEFSFSVMVIALAVLGYSVAIAL